MQLGFTLDDLEKRIRETGYIPRRTDIVGLAGTLLLVDQKAGAKAMVIMGPPGTGKSAFAAAVAKALSSELVVYQCHSWSDADELFVGVDVSAAVSGDASSVRQDVVLARVAKLSQEKGVVLLLDELDKTMERTESLLLDWLQSGRVPIKPGVHLQTNLNNVLVVATSNEQRDLTEAGTRRFCRLVMNPLDVKTQIALIHTRSGIPVGICKLLCKVLFCLQVVISNREYGIGTMLLNKLINPFVISPSSTVNTEWLFSELGQPNAPFLQAQIPPPSSSIIQNNH